MTDPRTATKRVVIISRPGQAESRMHAMLADGGVEVALSLDPSQQGPDAVRQANADAVVVLLEPSMEDALEQFQGLLHDPSLTVIFDEAELTLSRQGWDAARWMRHLLAKLHHHDDVLPPRQGSGSSTDMALPGAFAEQAGEADADASALGFDEATEPADDASAGDPELTWQPPKADAHDEAPPGLEELLRSLEASQADPDSGGDAAAAPGSAPELPAAASTAAHEPTDGSALASALSLADLDAEPGQVPSPAASRPPPDIDALEARIAHLELVDVDAESPADPPAADDAARPAEEAFASGGAVLVAAGIGGPDALRHLLGALPAEFDRAVLIQQKLEGARHDKLVQQLQRVSQMPVELASADAVAQPARVYVLPQDMGAQEQPDGQWRFVQGQPLLPAPGAERAPRCAVVVLSGADASTAGTDAWLTLPGVLALAQDTQTCFDPAGARAAIDTGARAVPPERIGETLASWANLGVRP